MTQGNGESKTSARRILAKERALEALELRKEGLSYSAIAERLDYHSPQGACEAIRRLLNTVITEPAEEIVRLELERLDSILEPTLKLAVQGNLQAVDRVIKIMDRRARYLGLDAPTKIAPTDPSGQNPYLNMSDDELFQQCAKIVDQHRNALPTGIEN